MSRFYDYRMTPEGIHARQGADIIGKRAVLTCVAEIPHDSNERLSYHGQTVRILDEVTSDKKYGRVYLFEAGDGRRDVAFRCELTVLTS